MGVGWRREVKRKEATLGLGGEVGGLARSCERLFMGLFRLLRVLWWALGLLSKSRTDQILGSYLMG